MIMAFFYNRCHNILIPMWIHFLFNFPLQLIKLDTLRILPYLAAGYCVAATILVAYARKTNFVKPIPTESNGALIV